MSRVLAFLLLAAPAAAGPRIEGALSGAAAREFARVEVELSESPTARRLLAATARLPRREVRGERLEEPVQFDAASRAVLVDLAALRGVTEWEARLWLTLALARAETRASVPLVESEQAAWQKVLRAAVELGARDPRGFGARLAEEVRAAAARENDLDRRALPERDPWTPGAVPSLELPVRILARVGLLLGRFERGPGHFYRAVELGTRWPPGTQRLREIEDLFALRAEALAALSAPPEGPDAELDGRRYPGGLARAAWRLRGTGEVERAREALEAFDTVGADGLSAAVREWRRAVGR